MEKVLHDISLQVNKHMILVITQGWEMLKLFFSFTKYAQYFLGKRIERVLIIWPAYSSHYQCPDFIENGE